MIQQRKVMGRIRVTREVMLEWRWKNGQYLQWLIVRMGLDYWWNRITGRIKCD